MRRPYTGRLDTSISDRKAQVETPQPVGLPQVCCFERPLGMVENEDTMNGIGLPANFFQESPRRQRLWPARYLPTEKPTEAVLETCPNDTPSPTFWLRGDMNDELGNLTLRPTGSVV
jgi:hypothetical protein